VKRRDKREIRGKRGGLKKEQVRKMTGENIPLVPIIMSLVRID